MILINNYRQDRQEVGKMHAVRAAHSLGRDLLHLTQGQALYIKRREDRGVF